MQPVLERQNFVIRQSQCSTKMHVLEMAHPCVVLLLLGSPSSSSSRSPEGSLFPKVFLDSSTPMPWDACLFDREQHYQTLQPCWASTNLLLRAWQTAQAALAA